MLSERSCRALLVSLALVASMGCQCGPGPDGLDASVGDSGTTGPDAGRDAGAAFDAGNDGGSPVDGGLLDAGLLDAGRVDAGLPDAGLVDAGALVSCAMLQCAPWETCVEGVGGGRCTGSGSIMWVSPVAGAVAPVDLFSVPLAINTSLGALVDVPWSSSGAIRSSGVFAGQAGVRSATLFLADGDGGRVVLTAGWDGGPNATTSFEVAAPIVRLPPTPVRPDGGSEFEPNDPAGPAFRRDDVVAIEMDELPQPMALSARLDAPMAQTLTVPVTERCDAGTCRRVDLLLRDLDFPAFRGRVLIWASGADGGVQTRPQSIPVTRWRWRRQVSGVPNPISVTRPVVSRTMGGIVIGWKEAAGIGGLVVLRAAGGLVPVPYPELAQSTFAVTSLTEPEALVISLEGPDGGWVFESSTGLTTLGSPIVSMGGANDSTLALGEDGTVRFIDFRGTQTSFTTCAAMPGPFVSVSASKWQAALLQEAGPICTFNQLSPPRIFSSTARSYLRHFVNYGRDNLGLVAAGVDGGLWSIDGVDGGLRELGQFDGGVVDGLVWGWNGFSAQRIYWVNADRTVQRADFSGGVFSNINSPSVARIPVRPLTSPVLVSHTSYPGVGSLVVVDSASNVSAFDIETLRLQWSLPAGDGGVGGRVDRDPIYIETCAAQRLGSLLIASAGSGSLYSFVGDLQGLRSNYGWPMGGRSPENVHQDSISVCVPEN